MTCLNIRIDNEVNVLQFYKQSLHFQKSISLSCNSTIDDRSKVRGLQKFICKSTHYFFHVLFWLNVFSKWMGRIFLFIWLKLSDIKKEKILKKNWFSLLKRF